MKKSFILYLDQQDLFNKLPDDVAGKLIKHIFGYVNCEDPETDDLLIDIAFQSIKQSLKRDLEKWDKSRQQRSEAGKASALKRANEKQRKATTVESRSTNSTVSDSVSVNVNVSDSVTDKILKKETIVSEYPYPPELNLPAWQEWKAYRRENKIKAYRPTPRSEGMAITKLLSISTSYDNQAEIIKESMGNSWSGLFPIKTKMTLQQSNQQVLENWNPDE